MSQDLRPSKIESRRCSPGTWRRCAQAPWDCRGLSGARAIFSDRKGCAIYSCGSKFRRGYAGFGPCFHLPGFHLGYIFLSHGHIASWMCPVCLFLLVGFEGKPRGHVKSILRRRLPPKKRRSKKQRGMSPAFKESHGNQLDGMGKETRPPPPCDFNLSMV